MKIELICLDKKIQQTQEELDELIQKRRLVCPHDDIKYDSWCDDTYSQWGERTYTQTYKCSHCGLYASKSSKEEATESFKILERLHRKHIYEQFGWTLKDDE